MRGLQTYGSGADGELVREVGLMRSRLEFAGTSDDPAVIDQLAHETQISAVGAGLATADAYFRQAGTIVWSH